MSNELADYELEQIQHANASGRQPVVFVHGLWLLPNSWDRWADHFETHGYVAVKAGWPDDPQTVAEANADPETFANKSIGQVASHYAQVIGALDKKPAVIGHSFGGLLTEILAGRGLAAVSVAISPAPFRGVLPLPISALKSGWPVLKSPQNKHRAVALTFEQFQYAFGNAVTDDEARDLFDRFAVPGAGEPLFQSAAANLNPWTEAKVEKSSNRGPMLLIAGAVDHTVPPAIVKASYEVEKQSADVTEYLEIPRRGHSLTIDSGWQEVVGAALEFVERYEPASVRT